MSKTMFIEYHGEGFWAYDVAVGVFLKHLVDRASQYADAQPSAWLSDCIERWRVNAVITDYGLHLDPAWTDSQRQLVRTLIDEARKEMEKVEAFSAEEAASWDLHDGQGIFSRGEARILTAPSIELGQAIGLILDGALPEAPSGTWWFYGVPDGVSTIQKKVA
jgi:hypothetical protein